MASDANAAVAVASDAPAADATAEEPTTPVTTAADVAADAAPEAPADASAETATEQSEQTADANDSAEQTDETPARGRGRSRSRNRNRNKADGAEKNDAATATGSTDEAEPPAQNAQRDNAGQRENAGQSQRDNAGQNGQQAQQQQGGAANSRNRQRNKRRGQNTTGDEFETEIGEDDVLVPIAGVLDVLDNYAFVRTTGYLPGPSDVYVSLGQVKKYNLRKGDAVVGAIKQPREGEQQGRQKYNALVQVDSINGLSVDDAAARVEFNNLTPLYPQERLRLETGPEKLTQRIIDLVAPVGKGQRGLIVAPPKAGKTIVLQQIANAIATNNPEVHLMVVLVDERPEEVTDMQRTSAARSSPRRSTVPRKTTRRSPSWRSSARSVSWSSVATSSCCSTRSPVSAARTTSPPPPRAACSPAVSTPRRCTRPSASSARRATSRTADRSPSSPRRWSRPAPRWMT